jgi:hypothetical protein
MGKGHEKPKNFCILSSVITKKYSLMLRYLLFFVFLLAVVKLKAQDDNQNYKTLTYAQIDSLMMVYYAQGTFDLTYDLLEKTIDRVEQELGTKDSMYLVYWNTLSEIYMVTTHPKSEEALQKTVEVSINIFGKNSIHYTYALTVQGQFFLKMEQLSKLIKTLN